MLEAQVKKLGEEKQALIAEKAALAGQAAVLTQVLQMRDEQLQNAQPSTVLPGKKRSSWSAANDCKISQWLGELGPKQWANCMRTLFGRPFASDATFTMPSTCKSDR